MLHELEDLRTPFDPPVFVRPDRFSVIHPKEVDIRITRPRERTAVAESAHRATVLARGNHGVVNGWIGFELFFGIVSVPVPPCGSDDDVSLRVGPISFRIRKVCGPGVGRGCGIVPRPSISLPNRQGGKHEVLLAHHLVAILSGRYRIVRNRGETSAVLGK